MKSFKQIIPVITLLLLAALPAIAAESVWVSSLEIRKGEQSYSTPRANRSATRSQISIRDRKFDYGVGAHAVSDICIDLKGAAQSFSAWVGVDDSAKGGGNVIFEVIGDGKTLWTSGPMTGKDPARQAEVNLKGFKLLVLHVGAADTRLSYADWADAKIAYNGAKPQAVVKPDPEPVSLPEGWRREHKLNTGWRFLRLDDPNAPKEAEAGFETAQFNDSKWEEVVLPHTPRIEKRDERYPFQGICWYRQSLKADPAWKAKRVSVQFGAAMQIAEVWLNGKRMVRHLGGYLPFTVDLTEDIRFDGPNALAVRLDNRDTTECPPGTSKEKLDFNYPGGLYRGARLLVTDAVHVSDPVAVGIEAGGGIFVQCRNLSAAKATVGVKTHVVNDGPDTLLYCSVLSVLRDPQGNEVARSQSQTVTIAAHGGHHFHQELEVVKPQLWHPDHPWLYTLETRVLAPCRVADRMNTRIGIRTFAIGKRLLINGEEFRIRGTNRHQEYPWIEYALTPNAHYRDARKIREAGFNFVRLTQYPHDSAFIDACDELGLLTQAPIAGFQFYSTNSSFVREAFQNVRDLIRRDRNHPSIVFWEPSLNESHGNHFAQWQRAAWEIAHAEFPGPECFTFGVPDEEAKGFVREYGDFGFGGNESTSRHLRREGEQGMLQQAWNYQWCFNGLSKRFGNRESEFLGCAAWAMFDYNRSYYHKPCACGMMDILRLPKFVYYFFQSQRDPAFLHKEIETGPMLFIANHWTPRTSPGKVVVYSNSEEVELSVNGKIIRRQKPDSGPDSPYSPKGFNYATVGSDFNASGGNPFDGGNGKNLAHPPFTFFDVPYEPGVLTAVGFINGQPAASGEARTPGKPASLKLVFDKAGRELAADGADAVFVRAYVLDGNGTQVQGNDVPITWAVEGPARIIGPNPGNAEAGIGSVLLQAGLQPGEIRVTATAPGLAPVNGTITSKP